MICLLFYHHLLKGCIVKKIIISFHNLSVFYKYKIKNYKYKIKNYNVNIAIELFVIFLLIKITI